MFENTSQREEMDLTNKKIPNNTEEEYIEHRENNVLRNDFIN